MNQTHVFVYSMKQFKLQLSISNFKNRQYIGGELGGRNLSRITMKNNS